MFQKGHKKFLIIITRPDKEAFATQKKVEALGAKARLVPLFQIEYTKTVCLPSPLDQGLVFTSINGVRAFLGNEQFYNHLHKPIFCVGHKMAVPFQKKGLHVIVGSGTAKSLAWSIVAKCSPKNGPLWYGCGREIKPYMNNILKEQGFIVKNSILYGTVRVNELPTFFYKEVGVNYTEIILFYSSRALYEFVRLVKQDKLEYRIHKMIAICLSKSIRQEALKDGFGLVECAQEPTQESLLERLKQTMAE